MQSSVLRLPAGGDFVEIAHGRRAQDPSDSPEVQVEKIQAADRGLRILLNRAGGYPLFPVAAADAYGIAGLVFRYCASPV
jgi:hypothetical protein